MTINKSLIFCFPFSNCLQVPIIKSSLVTQIHMERPAEVNRDQLPPPYKPTHPQPYTYEAHNVGDPGICTVSQSSNNAATADGMPPDYTQSFEDVNCFSEASIRRGVLICLLIHVIYSFITFIPHH